MVYRYLLIIFCVCFFLGNLNRSITNVLPENPGTESLTNNPMSERETNSDEIEENILQLNGEIFLSDEPEKTELILQMKNIADSGIPLAMKCYADWISENNPEHVKYMGMAALFEDFNAVKEVYWSINE